MKAIKLVFALVATALSACAQSHYNDVYEVRSGAYDKVIQVDDEVTNTLVIHNKVENITHVEAVKEIHYNACGEYVGEAHLGTRYYAAKMPRQVMIVGNGVRHKPIDYYEPIDNGYQHLDNNTCGDKWFFYFQLNSDFLSNRSELGHLIEFAKANPYVRLNIDAYADAGTGDYDANSRISNARANIVIKYLLREGIARNRIFVRCHGSSSQVYNTNELNRCVIVTAVYND